MIVTRLEQCFLKFLCTLNSLYWQGALEWYVTVCYIHECWKMLIFLIAFRHLHCLYNYYNVLYFFLSQVWTTTQSDVVLSVCQQHNDPLKMSTRECIASALILMHKLYRHFLFPVNGVVILLAAPLNRYFSLMKFFLIRRKNDYPPGSLRDARYKSEIPCAFLIAGLPTCRSRIVKPLHFKFVKRMWTPEQKKIQQKQNKQTNPEASITCFAVSP